VAERDLERGFLTARGLDRVLRVAWTVADLAGRDRPGMREVALALQLRTGVARGVPMVLEEAG
jgi:magnesium chelatase family protein